jgi:hypothetical protein
MPLKTTKIATVRREYLSAKREYHKLGKKAFGKPSRSTVQREYCSAKQTYRKAGRQLASLTGRKPHRR